MSDQAKTSASALWSRPAVWWGLSAATLILGYADLWRGGITMSAILLVIGYCVLIPVAILK